MNWGGVMASGVYTFDVNGDVAGFEATRYADFGGTFSLEPWAIAMKEYRSFEGIRIPYKCEVTWKLKTGDFTWLRLEITDLEYDRAEEY
jgi:hypothetical protein